MTTEQDQLEPLGRGLQRRRTGGTRVPGHHSPAFTLSVYVHLMADDRPGVSILDSPSASSWEGRRSYALWRGPNLVLVTPLATVAAS